MKKNLSLIAIIVIIASNQSLHAAANASHNSINSVINQWDVREKPGYIECISKTTAHRVIFEYGDICSSNCTAIVNAANPQLQGGSGVCGAIFKQAGWDQLQAYIDQNYKNGCKTGQAVITPSFNLKAKGIQHIIHAVGPIWKGGNYNERQLLETAYKNSLLLANKHKLDSIAFPFISSGIYKFPLEQAAQIAIETVLKNSDLVMEIKVVLYSPDDYTLFAQTVAGLVPFLK